MCAKVNNYKNFILKIMLKKIYKLSLANYVPLSLDKTVMMIFSQKTMLAKYNYRIAGRSIHRLNLVCDLGVNFETKSLSTRCVDIIIYKARRS